MMKKSLYFLLLMTSVTIFGQTKGVGINTNDPQATLDVNGKMMIREYNAVDPNAKLLYYPSDGTNVKISNLNISDLGYLYSNDFSTTFNITNAVNNYDRNVSYTHGIGNATFESLTDGLSLTAYVQLQLGAAYNLNLDTQLAQISGFSLTAGLYTKATIGLKFTNIDTGAVTYAEQTINFGEGQNYRLLKNRLLSINFSVPKGTYNVELISTKLPWNPGTNDVNNNGTMLNVSSAATWQNTLQLKIASASIQIIPFTPFYAQ